jgi:dihydrofolate reductase
VRNVVLYQLLSLDGVAEEPGDWFFDGGPEVFDNLSRVIGSQDAILLGRGTYEYWVDYWPTSDVEPFASFINRTEKHVFTSEALDRTWANSTFVTTDAVEYVARLKQGSGGDIGIHGSIEVARSLWRGGVIDELELVVAAVVAGSGRKLFEDAGDLQKLELLDAKTTKGGTLFLRYRRV